MFMLSILLLCHYVHIVVADEAEQLEKVNQHRIRCKLDIDEKDCPVDGGWGPWGEWGNCIGECGQVGSSIRRRECNNPEPMNNGKPCKGLDFESKDCHVRGCQVKDYRVIVKSDPIRAKQFDVLKQIHHRHPSLINKCLLAECQFELVYSMFPNLADTYWNALHCVKHNIGCPEMGGWSQWGQWSACTSECGLGKEVRCRSCDSPPPSDSDYNCTGDACTFRACIGLSCSEDKGKFWSEWNEWSQCSSSCGLGLMERWRSCVSSESDRYSKKQPFWNSFDIGFDCFTTSTTSETNLKRNSTTASTATRKTTRVNKSQPKRFFEKKKIENSCIGPKRELKPCYLKECPVDGSWSEWEPWSECTASCGMGSQWRSRACSNPPALQGGKPCLGLVTHTKNCFKAPCPGRTHEVAVFSGDGVLLYSATREPCRMLHLFIRYRPSSTSGELVTRRAEWCTTRDVCDEVKIKLVAGYLKFSVLISGTSRLSVTSQHHIKLNKWHTVLAMLTGSGVTLRLDDMPDYYTARFDTIPLMPNFDHTMAIGRMFKGEIEQVVINFKPRQLRREKPFETETPTELSPYSGRNVAYDSTEIEESFKDLSYLIRAPCPNNPQKWLIEMAIKPESSNGYIMLMKGKTYSSYLLLSLDSNRIWFTSMSDTGAIETSEAEEINIEQWFSFKIDKNDLEYGLSVNGGQRRTMKSRNISDFITLTCSELFIGNVKTKLNEVDSVNVNCRSESLPGHLGYLKIDEHVIDLESLHCSEVRHNKFSSHTISYSDKYEEIELPLGQQMNLTCIFNKNSVDDATLNSQQNQTKLLWLRFDTPIDPKLQVSGAKYDVYNNYHMMRLTASSYNSRPAIESFYSCWIQNPEQKSAGQVLYTFGVAIISPPTDSHIVDIILLILIDILVITFFSILLVWPFYEAVNLLIRKLWKNQERS